MAKTFVCDCGDGVTYTERQAESHCQMAAWSGTDGRIFRHDMTEVPEAVDGVPVETCFGPPVKVRGGLWRTLVPLAEGDDRLWEWDAATGRIIRTHA